MHEAKYTPGPWALQGNSTVIAPNMRRIKYGKNEEYERAYIVCQPDLYTDPEWGGEEKRANARLISAAPELLEALQACIEKGKRWHPCDPIVVQALAAIAKATGN